MKRYCHSVSRVSPKGLLTVAIAAFVFFMCELSGVSCAGQVSPLVAGGGTTNAPLMTDLGQFIFAISAGLGGIYAIIKGKIK